MTSRNPIPLHEEAPAAPVAGLWRRWGNLLIGGTALVLLIGLMWYLLSGTASTRREAPSTALLMLPPPPPPPPEPEKLPEPVPDKVVPEVVEVEPVPVEPLEAPADDTPPSPSQDLGDPVTMDASAQAGADAFGIAAGRGGGMTGGVGGGLGSRTYASYVTNALQQAFVRDPRTRHLAFDDIRVDLWLDTQGRAVRVQLVLPTGQPQVDEAVLSMVRDFAADERPPASMRYPMRMTIKGQRPR